MSRIVVKPLTGGVKVVKLAGAERMQVVVRSGAPLTSAAPANVTKAAAVAGVSSEAARADHKHDITTAAPTTLVLGGANAEGVSTALARADHVHAIEGSGTPPALKIYLQQNFGGL
jgi:hypothetical protein